MANVKSGQTLDQAASDFRLSPETYTTLDTLVKTTKDFVLPELIQSYGDQGITGFLKLTGAINNGGTFRTWRSGSQPASSQPITSSANSSSSHQ